MQRAATAAFARAASKRTVKLIPIKWQLQPIQTASPQQLLIARDCCMEEEEAKGDDFNVSNNIQQYLLEGNKYWKAQYLLADNAVNNNTKHIYSHGGYQSNAMLALAQLCHYNNINFTYITRRPPQHMRDKLHDNFSRGNSNFERVLHLQRQAQQQEQQQYFINIIECQSKIEYDSEIAKAKHQSNGVFVSQGIAEPQAEIGIIDYVNRLKQALATHNDENHQLILIVPSGTGTTAYFIAKHFTDAQVLTTPVYGSEEDLMSQLQLLMSKEREQQQQTQQGQYKLPSNLVIIKQQDQWSKSNRGSTSNTSSRHKFAQLNQDYLQAYEYVLKETTGTLEIDLIYAPPTLLNTMHYIATNYNSNNTRIVYIHTGGTSGNASMLERYRTVKKL